MIVQDTMQYLSQLDPEVARPFRRNLPASSATLN